MEIEILDTTLRDGAQCEGISFSVQDKLGIIKTLDRFGVKYIEAGNPASNPKDIDFFKKASLLNLKNSTLVAFGSTVRKGLLPNEDLNLSSLISSGAKTLSIFGKSCDTHVRQILKAELEENLRLIKDTICYLKSNGFEVIFDAEHFFDGLVSNKDYALTTLRTALEAGADVVVLCDTNGGRLPNEIEEGTKLVRSIFPNERLGIHCHNDTGCAVYSSICAAQSGAGHIQGTFIGIGERCGNTDLSVLIPNLELKLKTKCISGNLSDLSYCAQKIAEIANIKIPKSTPYIGNSAFAHKGGMHIDGVSKLHSSFEHVKPSLVGNSRRLLMSEMAGRALIVKKLESLFGDIPKDAPEIENILKRLKELEYKGYQFESADASFELIALKAFGKFTPHFKLELYKTSGEYPAPEKNMNAWAMLKIIVDGKGEITASIGNGPVNALDLALRQALCVFYPQLTKVKLTDYKVRILNPQTTGSTTRVLIESSDGENVWTTVGVSTDIVAASWEALVDSIEYVLHKTDKTLHS